MAHGVGIGGCGGAGMSTEVVEALEFLMVSYKEEGKLAECEACAVQLVDTAGPEKDEAKAMLRDLRNFSVGMGRAVPNASDISASRRYPGVHWARGDDME